MFEISFMADVPFPSGCETTELLGERVRSLQQVIGVHPPNIGSLTELALVERQYSALDRELGDALNKQPENLDLLFIRGCLHVMGYNIDRPGAWEQATADFEAVLRVDPRYVPAMIELALLWLYSEIDLAGDAEEFFRRAQYCYGEQPLEVAQHGIFYALFYQGKFEDALDQSIYMQSMWPGNKRYRLLNQMAKAALGIGQENKKNNGDITNLIV